MGISTIWAGGMMATKTTITISAKARAAFEAMRAETPGLTLSDFYDTAVTFWLAYGDHASLKPMIRHLSTVSSQLSTGERELQHIRPPPIDHQRLGEIAAKQVVETLIPVVAPPVKRGWLSRLFGGIDIDTSSEISTTYAQQDICLAGVWTPCCQEEVKIPEVATEMASHHKVLCLLCYLTGYHIPGDDSDAERWTHLQTRHHQLDQILSWGQALL
jgi:hypothetical protein